MDYDLRHSGISLSSLGFHVWSIVDVNGRRCVFVIIEPSIVLDTKDPNIFCNPSQVSIKSYVIFPTTFSTWTG